MKGHLRGCQAKTAEVAKYMNDSDLKGIAK